MKRDATDPEGWYDRSTAPKGEHPEDQKYQYSPGPGTYVRSGDSIEAPDHYTYGGKECIEFIKAIGEKPGYCIGNAMKYIYRHKHKGDPAGDIRKAIRCLEMYLEEL